MSALKPFDFQNQMRELIANGHSIILQAPTGAGKTMAALYPYLSLLAQQDRTRFPQKCIYAVPMRVLANQFTEKYDQYVENLNLKHHIRPKAEVTIQTGEHPTDPHFEGTLIFATIDQLLSSFLNIPYGVGTRFANLNAGAVVSSYLVFDEFHLFDPDAALPTTLEMLKLLKGITPFVLMTATFSRMMLESLAEQLDAEIIPPPDADVHEYFGDIPAQKNRERIFEWVDAPLTADHVLKHHKTRTICICNVVDRATQLYDDLINHPDRNSVKVTLLHSRFLQADRAKKESTLSNIFGEASHQYDGEPHILVATQVIEVGVDITCDVLHTELAPAASLLQRAGRCARRDGEHGAVYVYDLPFLEPDDGDSDDEQGEPQRNYLPYHVTKRSKHAKREPRTQHGKTLMDNTMHALQSGEFTGQHMDFEREQAFINRVHSEVDAAILTALETGQTTRLDTMFATIANHARENAPELIRKTENTLHAIIHPDPNSDDDLLNNPWHYQGFSLRPSLVSRAWKQAEEDGLLDMEILPWIVMEAQAADAASDMEDGEGQNLPRYTWKPLNEAKEVYRASLAIALHPHFAQYSQERGLVLGEIGERDAPALTPLEKPLRGSYDGYQLETYAEHIQGLYEAYAREHQTEVWRTETNPTTGKRRPKLERVPRPALRQEITYAVHRIEQSARFGLRPGLIDEVIRLTIALHDIGKLSVNWQAFAHEWQRIVNERYANGEDRNIPPDYMAAHTDYDPRDEAQRVHNRAVRNKMQPGNHAGEGAVAAIPLLLNVCEQATDLNGGHRLYRAAVTAIAHHHTPTVKDYHPFDFDPAARSAIEAALTDVGLPQFTEMLGEGIIWQVDEETGSLDDNMVHPSRHNQQDALLYMLLARTLRLADGRSFGV